MKQGLLEWLNAVNNKDNATGLLLAPVDVSHQITRTAYEPYEPDPEAENDPHQPQEHEMHGSAATIQLEDVEPEHIESEHVEPEHVEPEDIEPKHVEPAEPVEPKDTAPANPDEPREPTVNEIIGIPDDIKSSAGEITNEIQDLKREIELVHGTETVHETHELDLNKAWHEASAGFELSLKEPPPQIWTPLNESESEDDDTSIENEDNEHIILEQSSSLTLHGTNFTQRLQKILQGRKTKAAELKRKSSEKNKKSHSYIKRGFLVCSVVLIALGAAWLLLLYLQTFTPESFSKKASKLYEQGKYEEAMNVYQEAYRRYPKILKFLAGIAGSAEKAGHTQTAAIARNEYNNALPKEKSEKKEKSEDIKPEIKPENKTELFKINVNTEGGNKESESESHENEKQEQEQNREKIAVQTFDEYLDEANRLYNIGMYTKALAKFFDALERRSDDIRPYIGIAESYRAKGMYLDAEHILREARSRFGINPTIETLRRLLRRNRD